MVLTILHFIGLMSTSIGSQVHCWLGTSRIADHRRSCTLHLCLGTTGLPKAANISHARVMQRSPWSAGMMDVQPDDRIYNCLRMQHSVGGVQTISATLIGGGSVVICEKFSASQFWSDVIRWDCTLFAVSCSTPIPARMRFTIGSGWPVVTEWPPNSRVSSKTDSGFPGFSNSMQLPRAVSR